MPLKLVSRIATIIQASTEPVTFDVFNLDFSIPGASIPAEGIVYHKATSNFKLKKAEVQIFDKGGVSSGSLTIDIKKGLDADDLSMTSVFSVLPTLNFATVLDYASNEGTFNTSPLYVTEGDILRLDISSLPSGVSNFRVILTGEK